MSKDKLGALSLILHAIANAQAEVKVVPGYYIVIVNNTMTLLYDRREVTREEIEEVINDAKS